MWDKLKSISQHPAAKAVKKFCGDPVQLYSVFLVMTAMYYYHKQYAWLYTILTLAVSFVLMRFYDFVAKKRLIGPVCYLIFLALGLYSVSLLTHLGEQSYPLTFFVWFLTPQGVVDFSLIYTIAIYLLMTGFITSAVYYFAQVRYRMVMQFIIMMIPLSLYAKEGLQMPALLVILLLSSFFLLMVYCRQLRENDAVRLMDGLHSGVSIALFVAAFSVTAAIIPKPQFQADREFIDNAMSYSTLSDTLMKAISMFTESTNNTGTVSNNARTIGYADSREMLRLRTQTYSYYSGSNDSWNVISQYDKPDREYSEPLTYQPRVLTQAILDAAAADADFAAKYDLTDLIGLELPPQDLYTLSLYTLTPVLPIPTRTTGIRSGLVENIFRSDSGAITGDIRSTGISVDYYSDMYVLYDAEAEVLNRLDHESYPELLYDAEQILLDSDPEAAELGKEIWTEYVGDGKTFADAKTVGIGMDEYYGSGSDYVDYFNTIANTVSGLDPDMTVRAWGSFDWYGADPQSVSTDVQMQVWQFVWQNPEELYEDGFSVINSMSSHLYIIPGGGYDRLDMDYLKDTWEPNVFEQDGTVITIPAYSSRMPGAVYMMWNEKTGTDISEDGLYERFSEPLGVLSGKLW